MMAICFSFLCWISSTALMAIAGYLIAAAAERPELAALSLGIVGVRFFGLSRGVFRYVERLFSHSLAFKELKKIRLQLYKTHKLFGITEGKMLNKISSDAEEYKSWLPKAGVSLFAGIASLIVSVSVLAYLDLRYAAIFSAVSFLLLVISVLTFFLSKKRVKEWRDSKEELSEFSLSVAHGMAEKKSWGIFGKISDTWEKLGNIEEEKRKKAYSICHVAEIFSTAAPFLCIAGMFAIGKGEYSFPIWTGILLGTLAAFELLQELPSIALQSAISFLSSPLLEGCPKGGVYKNHSLLSSNIELSLNKGDVLIINAPSGAGKTLLANSIAGFHKSDAILERTDDFIFLEQEPFLFTGTVKDNLLFAQPNATEEDMLLVLQKVGLEKFSLDLWVGERGFSISGGERQKLAAARVMLCKTDLIIADEPGANMPLEDEKKLFSEFVNLPNKPAVLWFSPYNIFKRFVHVV